jgi:hypothetical protein
VEVESAGAPLGAGVYRGGRGVMQGTEAGCMLACFLLQAALDMPRRARGAAGRIGSGDGGVIAGKWERGWLAVVKDCEGE